jgi:hypothetical protein
MESDDPTTEEFRARVYVGQSRRGDDEFSLEAALDEAYQKAKNDNKTGPFRVLEIWIDGNNPLSEYKVAVGSGS